MKLKTTTRRLALAAACGLVATISAAAAAAPEAVKDIVTPDGVFTVPVERPVGPVPGGPVTRQAWFYDVSPGIGNSVDVSSDHTWGAVRINDSRLAVLENDGNGVPIWEFSSVGPGGVAAAKEGDIGAYLDDDNGLIRLQVFNSTSSEPEWSFTFDSPLTIGPPNAIAVSRDSSVVAAGVRGGGNNLVVFFDAETGDEISRWDTNDGSLAAIDLTDDGSLAMVSLGNRPRVIDTATGDLIWSGTGSGAGTVDYRISGDGSIITVGGFNLDVYEWDGSTYVPIINFSTPPTEWFGFGTHVSRDGSTVGSMSRESATNDINVRMWDVATGDMIGHVNFPPVPGTFQTSPRGADSNNDGSMFAFAMWGDGTGVYPEVMVFDRDVEQIGEIDMPGSANDVAMTPNGQWVVTTGKAVHANVFGNGGQIVAEEFEVGIPCIADWNGDGEVDINDFFAYLADFEAGDPRADLNNDGEIDINDFFIFLQEFEAGC